MVGPMFFFLSFILTPLSTHLHKLKPLSTTSIFILMPLSHHLHIYTEAIMNHLHKTALKYPSLSLPQDYSIFHINLYTKLKFILFYYLSLSLFVLLDMYCDIDLQAYYTVIVLSRFLSLYKSWNVLVHSILVYFIN